MAVSRRSILAGLGGIASISLVGCSGNSKGGGGNGQVSVFYWGADSRARTTNQVFDLFAKKHPGSSAKGQFLAFNNYFDKLATLAASGSLPDIIQTNPGSLTQYGANDQLLDLSTLSLNLGDYQSAALESGKVNGKQYGLAFGYQYVTMYCNTNIVKNAGIAVPSDSSSQWQDWADYAVKLQGKLPSGVFAMTDNSSDSNSFESWVVGRGKTLFTNAGKLGHDVSDVADWFRYWTDLRGKGAIAPSAESVTYVQTGTVTDSPLTKGKAALSLGINVGFQGYQQVNKATLDLAACPAGPVRRSEANHFFGWSVSSQTKLSDTIKSFLEFWFTDTDVISILGTDRALVASEKQLDALDKTADATTKKLLQFSIDHPDIKPLSPPATPSSVGSGQTDALQRAAEAVVTGSSDPEKAATSYMQQVEGLLGG